MTRVYLLVEGQTEEVFVNELLRPHFEGIGIYLTPIIVSTSRGYKGGVLSFAQVKPQIERLCKQDRDAYVTTMFDLYALPEDFPGRGSDLYPAASGGKAKAEFLEAELGSRISLRNFIPNLLAHEFEALLFVELNAFRPWTDNDRVLEPLRAVRRIVEPEDINDGRHTAPSKRILAVMPRYQKTIHGPLIACDIGLQAIRDACPHFGDWIQRIEGLVN